MPRFGAIEAGVIRDGIETSGGIAGIYMTLGIVDSLCGHAVANETAAYIEYRRL